MGEPYSEADGLSLPHRKPIIPYILLCILFPMSGLPGINASCQSRGVAPDPTPKKCVCSGESCNFTMVDQGSWCGREDTVFHEIDTSEPKREENQILSVIFK
jgi:hypothetical protein